MLEISVQTEEVVVVDVAGRHNREVGIPLPGF